MTVFCMLYSDLRAGEEPVVISDVLVTTSVRLAEQDQRYSRTYIPSIGGVYPQVASDASIAGLCQKLHVTPDGACIAFAGDLDSAVDFHHSLCRKGDLQSVLDACTDFRGNLQFAVYFPDAARKTHYICHSDDCLNIATVAHGRVIIGGSGETTMKRLVLQHAMKPLAGDPNVMRIARALYLVNEALELDDANPEETLGNKFGAYYEIAAYEDGTFRKLDRVAHHYFRYVEGEDHGRLCLVRSYFHEYLGKDLIVRRVVAGMDGEQISVWQDCYVINGFDAPLDLAAAAPHINSHLSTPDWEVVSIDLGGYVSRVVSIEQPLVSSQLVDGRWYCTIDQELGRKIIGEIEKSMTGNGA